MSGGHWSLSLNGKSALSDPTLAVLDPMLAVLDPTLAVLDPTLAVLHLTTCKHGQTGPN